jgi:hypothetical protein
MEREAIESFEHKGLKVNIYQDESYDQSPSDNGDDDLFLVHYHRDFDVRRDDIITKEDCETRFGGEKILQDKKYHFFLTKTYIHSGVVLALEESGKTFPDECWDVSRIGHVLVSKKEVRTRKAAYKLASGLVEEWNDILSGNVYGYMITKNKTCPTCKHTEEEHLGSCWGFVGDMEGCKKEAIAAAESNVPNGKQLKLAL